MESRERLILVALAAVIAVAAFVALSPGGDDDETAGPAATQPSTTTGPETGPEPGETSVPPGPKPQYVRVRDGKPLGGVKTISVRKGQTVRFVVQSDAQHEVHLHGYDIGKRVAPGREARYRFRAEKDGIYEIELEDIGEPIASLRVEP